MRPSLTFDTIKIRMSTLGRQSCVPDLRAVTDPRKDREYIFDDPEEVYAGYGGLESTYPYRLYDCVKTELTERELNAAILENDYLRAVFLPGLGGRLWSLTDKETGRELLYTNDVICLRNLAIRNAWFSGGVEWNIGIIGHTPFTTDQLFTAHLTDDEGNPVLRMYEYERIRKAEYQMDFWLEEEDRFLNCRMRIVNSGEETVPMYWWSNIAVSEYQKGRLVVPASRAFSGGVKKEIPWVDGIDVTNYEDIPNQVDYFFDIPRDMPKYIVNVDQDGFGLLQFSTDRLRGRKLFSWGNNEGSKQWQGFLTDKAGNYIEMQAGLGKTQGGCVPMPAHGVWEWVERYGAIQLAEGENRLPFEELRDIVTERVRALIREKDPGELLEKRASIALKRAQVIYRGSGYGAFRNFCQALEGKEGLSSHLDFGVMEERQQVWADFLSTGVLHEPGVETVPEDFVWEKQVYDKLEERKEAEAGNWYAWYQMGLYNFWKGNLEAAKEYFGYSLERKESPWAYHALASCYAYEKEDQKAISCMEKGLLMRRDDLAYVKDGFRILLQAKGYGELVGLYDTLPEEIREESRIQFGWVTALSRTGEKRRAYDFLKEHQEDYTLDDLRECDTSLEKLWIELETDLFGACKGVPKRYRFASME